MAYNTEKCTSTLTPVKLNSQEIDNYYLDNDGNLYSTAYLRWYCRDGMPARKIRWAIAGKTKYPRCVLRIDGIPKNENIHKIVAETFIEKPLPPGVSKNDWKNTPESVKRCFDNFWEINHIDHDPTNFHPSNLEWVSRKENINKYREYRITVQ
jgi:hypothetical protein